MADEQIGPGWVTKYASEGRVYKVDRRPVPLAGGYMSVQLEPGGPSTLLNRRDWHTDRTTAVAQVEQLLADRIASLEKRLAVARAMDAEQIVPR